MGASDSSHALYMFLWKLCTQSGNVPPIRSSSKRTAKGKDCRIMSSSEVKQTEWKKFSNYWQNEVELKKKN